MDPWVQKRYTDTVPEYCFSGAKKLNLYTTKTKQRRFYYNHNMLNICFYGIKGTMVYHMRQCPFPDEKYNEKVTLFLAFIHPCVFVTWEAAHLRHNGWDGVQ